MTLVKCESHYEWVQSPTTCQLDFNAVERRKRGVWTLEGLENFVFCFLFYGNDWTIMTARKEMGVELITTKTTMNIKKKNCPAHIFFTLFSTNIF